MSDSTCSASSPATAQPGFDALAPEPACSTAAALIDNLKRRSATRTRPLPAFRAGHLVWVQLRRVILVQRCFNRMIEQVVGRVQRSTMHPPMSDATAAAISVVPMRSQPVASPIPAVAADAPPQEVIPPDSWKVGSLATLKRGEFMKKRFADEQVVRILRGAESKQESIRDVCKRHDIT